MAVQAKSGGVLGERYRLQHCLGTGGMGSVWQARDLVLHRSVAIKTAARTGAGHPGAYRRLHREAAVISSLTQPNLARVYDYFDTGDEAFIVMELVEGESLADRLTREGRLAPADAADIAAQVAGALHAAHQADVVHRDVKPSNIMLTDHGVKVVDFGIAATIRPSAPGAELDTVTQELVGTAAYLAPERATGAPDSPAADIYSLGVVLYQMLAGRLPFQADGAIPMLYAHITAKVDALPAEVPPRLAEICLGLLAKDPGARPASAADVAASLRDEALLLSSAAHPAVDTQPADALPAPHQEGDTHPLAGQLPPRRERGRRRFAGALLAVPSLALVTTVTLAAWPSTSTTATARPEQNPSTPAQTFSPVTAAPSQTHVVVPAAVSVPAPAAAAGTTKTHAAAPAPKAPHPVTAKPKHHAAGK